MTEPAHHFLGKYHRCTGCISTVLDFLLDNFLLDDFFQRSLLIIKRAQRGRGSNPRLTLKNWFVPGLAFKVFFIQAFELFRGGICESTVPSGPFSLSSPCLCSSKTKESSSRIFSAFARHMFFSSTRLLCRHPASY